MEKNFILPHLDIKLDKLGTAVGFCYPQIKALSTKGKFIYIDEPVFASEKKETLDIYGMTHLMSLHTLF